MCACEVGGWRGIDGERVMINENCGMWYLGLDPGTKKRINRKTGEIQIVCGLVFVPKIISLF